MSPAAPYIEHRFPSMGTEIEVMLVGEPGRASHEAFRLAETMADHWTRIFSRFEPASEISRLNAAPGRSVSVSVHLFTAISEAVRANQVTGGLFDPTIHDALVAAGYDRPMRVLERSGPGPERSTSRAPGIDGIDLDPHHTSLTLRNGAHLDLGGIAKGLYVGSLADHLAHWPGGMVSAGGDLQCWGRSPDSDGWLIDVEDPENPARDVATIRLRRGAVATSGTSRRSWRRGGAVLHHLIDPTTGMPATTPVRSVTVISETAVDAEIAATALFISGTTRCAPSWLWNLASSAIIITERGEVIHLRRDEEHCVDE